MGTSAGATGLPTKTVAHDGTVTFYTYDAKGRETEKATFPASFATSTTKPALANATTVTSTQWHGTFNLPTKRAEPGKITAYTYSATTGNLTGQSETQTTDTTGAAKFTAAQATNTPIKSTGWSYNATSQLPTTIVERETAFGSTVAVQVGKLTYTHDALGNATSLKDLQVTPNLTATFSSYTKSGLLLAGADETGTSFTLTLDSRERLKTYQYGTSYTSQYTYLSWGGLSQTTSSDGDVLKYFYTPSQQLIRMEENGEVVYRVALNGSMHKFRDRLLALRRLPIQVVNSIVPQAHAVPLVIPFIVGAGEFVTCQALRAAATRAVPYMLMGIRAWGAAERVIAIGERDTSNADDKSDAIPIPAKPNQSQSCTCNCRARENKNRVSEKDCKNCQVVKFVIAQATASSCNEAQKLAKAEAKKTLGEQAKHDGCVCTDSKGNRIRTTGG
jgi:YD repeat-containing protein